MAELISKTYSFKTEGTTQTWGQLAVKDSSPSSLDVINQSSVSTFESSDSNTQIALQNPLTDNIRSDGIPLISSVTGLADEPIIPSYIRSNEEISSALEESKKVDMFIAMKSKRSKPVDMNLLKVPELASKFVYNFFEEGESDVVFNEKPGSDPLLKRKPFRSPKYVQLNWTTVRVIEVLSGTEAAARENEALKQTALVTPRGVISDSSTTTTDSKQIASSFSENGQLISVIDLQAPEVGFSSIANDYEFSNTIGAILDTSSDEDDVAESEISTTSTRGTGGSTTTTSSGGRG